MASPAPAEVNIQARVVGAQAAIRDLERINQKMADPNARKALQEIKSNLDTVNDAIKRNDTATRTFIKSLSQLRTKTRLVQELKRALTDVGLTTGQLSARDVSPLSTRQAAEGRAQGLAQGVVQGLGGPGAGALLQRGFGGPAQLGAFIAARTLGIGAQALIQPQNVGGALGRIPLIGPTLGALTGVGQQAGQAGLSLRRRLSNATAGLGGVADTNAAQAARARALALDASLDRVRTADAVAGTGEFGELPSSEALQANRPARIEQLTAQRNQARMEGDPRLQLFERLVQQGARFGFERERALEIASAAATEAGGQGFRNERGIEAAFALQRFGIDPELSGRALRGSTIDDRGPGISDTITAALNNIRAGGFSGAEETRLLRQIAENIAEQTKDGIKFSSTTFTQLAGALSAVPGIAAERAGTIAESARQGFREIGLEGPQNALQTRILLRRARQLGGGLDANSIARAAFSLQQEGARPGDIAAFTRSAVSSAGTGNTPIGRLFAQAALRETIGAQLGEGEIAGVLSPDRQTSLGTDRPAFSDFVREAADRRRVDPTEGQRARAEAQSAGVAFTLAEAQENLNSAQQGVVEALGNFTESIKAFTNLVNVSGAGGATTQ